MRKLIIFWIIIFFYGCSTHIQYTPKKIDITQALENLDELLMTQPKWGRPVEFTLTDNYLGFNYGTRTLPTSGIVTPVRRTIDVGERFYFKYINDIKMTKWRRGWFIVTIYSTKNIEKKHLYYSKDEKDAKLVFDSLSSIINDKKLKF